MQPTTNSKENYFFRFLCAVILFSGSLFFVSTAYSIEESETKVGSEKFIGQATLEEEKALLTAEKIKQNVQSNFPQIKVDSVRKSVAGLYEVKAGSLILYASSDARYLVHGEVLDMHNAKSNITEESRKVVREKLMQEIKSDDYIEYKAKDERFNIIVFTDVSCGYCRKLHGEIKELNALGISVRYLPFPRAGIDSLTYKTAESVWCSHDPNSAMHLAMEGQKLSYIPCSRVISSAQKIAIDLGVNATPTILLNDGTLLPGYLEPKNMLAMLEKNLDHNVSGEN